MGASNDALIVHPPQDIEGIQFKSSDYITRGREPTTFLELGKKSDKGKGKATIWREFNKVTNPKHKGFYSGLVTHKEEEQQGKGKKKHRKEEVKPYFTFAVVSNKPLDKYDAICKAVAKDDKKNGLPSGVILICHEVFQSYAACFAHRGLFIPISSKRKQDSPGVSQTEGGKKQKMECDDEEEEEQNSQEEEEEEEEYEDD